MNDIVFNTEKFNKFFLGADQIITALSAAHNSIASSYPPYNVAKVGDNKYLIELAVAGFGKHNLNIEIVDNKLVIKGNTTLDDLYVDNPFTYLYKGIAERSFTRVFNLSDTIEFQDAELVNGMLKLWFENIIPETKKPKKIEIKEKEKEGKK